MRIEVAIFVFVFIFIELVKCQTTNRLKNNSTKHMFLKNYTIGYITSERNSNFDDKLKDLQTSVSHKRIVLKKFQLINSENPIDLTLNLCEILETSVYAIVSAIKRPVDDKTLLISYLCSYYQIPLVSLYNRESVFFDKSVHHSFIRMTPSYFSEAYVWLHLLNKLMYKKINFIHSIDDNGQLVSSKFQYLADQYEIEIEKVISYVPDEDDYKLSVRELTSCTSKVMLLQAKSNDAEKILQAAKAESLLENGNVWIVNEEAFYDLNVFKLRNGIISVRYVEEIDPLNASLALITRAVETVKNLDKKGNNTCNDLGIQWNSNDAQSDETDSYHGKSFYDEIIKRQTSNRTMFKTYNQQEEIIEFDDEGDRLSATYEIVNVKSEKLVAVGSFKINSTNVSLSLNESDIIWLSNSTAKPDGTKWSKNFTIVTIEEKPFIFKTLNPFNKSCFEIQTNSVNCSHTVDNVTTNYCCFGYCIDLIKKMADILKFDYHIYLVPDSTYGDYDPQKKNWSGLMGELLSSNADMILAPFTINPERANHVDFTKPFKYQGITILVKRNSKDSSFASFLQPFKETLWIMVLLSVHVVAFVLYLLDRFSPFGRFKLSKTENTEEDALNLSRALWFTWGVLLNSGIGEGTPRSFSARVLGMVWAGFAMIMVASYTANLAAFLVLDRPEASISGINDARLRNPQDGFNYATVRGSAVEKYFKRQVELSTMYRTMENKNFNSTEDALKDLRAGKISAFIWDSARLEYEAGHSCDFVTAGELFGRSSYGLALRKGNPWLNKLSLSILYLHEKGFMEDLDTIWILRNKSSCQDDDSSPSTLGLTNMAGVFILVAGGIVMGIFLIFIEIAYKRYKDRKAKEQEVSRSAFATWRKNVEKRKLKMTCETDFSKSIIKSHSTMNTFKKKVQLQSDECLKPLNHSNNKLQNSLYPTNSATVLNQHKQTSSNNFNKKKHLDIYRNDLNV